MDDDGKDKDSPEAARLAGIALREGARIVSAVTVLVTALWFLAQPYIAKVANEQIDARRLATASKVETVEKQLDAIERKVERTQDEASDTADAVIELKADVGSVKELLTEQRQDIKSLLRSMIAPRNPPQD